MTEKKSTIIKAKPLRGMGVTGLVVDTAVDDSDKTFTVPAQRWVLKTVHVTYTSTATAGNRVVVVEIKDAAGNNIARYAAGLTQAASLTYHYTFGPGLPNSAAVSALTAVVGMPETYLHEGYQVRVYDQAAIAAAADDMIVRLTVERR